MENPLRSEAAMFRVVVAVAVAAVPLIALGLIGGAAWAIGGLVVEAAVGLWLLRRRRGA
jgi:hypothetical protein